MRILQLFPDRFTNELTTSEKAHFIRAYLIHAMGFTLTGILIEIFIRRQ